MVLRLCSSENNTSGDVDGHCDENWRAPWRPPAGLHDRAVLHHHRMVVMVELDTVVLLLSRYSVMSKGYD